MRYRPHEYAEALFSVLAEASAEGEKDIMARFVALVDRLGDRSYLPKILEEFERRTVLAKGGRVVTIEFARQPEESALKKLSGRFNAADRIKIKIDPALVAGARITENGEHELDQSLAGRLKKMFEK